MRQVKIVSLITWYLLYLFQAEICGLEFRGNAVGRGDSIRRDTSTIQHVSTRREIQDHNPDYILMSPSARKSAFAVLNDRRHPPNFKAPIRVTNFDPTPQIDFSKKNNRIFDLKRVSHESENKSGMKSKNFIASSLSTTIRDPVLWSLAKIGKSLSRTTESKRDPKWPEVALARHEPPLSSGQNISVSLDNSLNYPQHSFVKRAIESDLLDEKQGKHARHADRTPKMRIAGLKVSDFGPPTELYCPALPVTTRTIVSCTNGRKIGSKCLLRCASGFKLAGNRRSRRCRTNKRKQKYIPYWSGKQSDFQCVPICRKLKQPEHGNRYCQMVDLSVGKAFQCETECKRGFKVVGRSKTTCLENGQWSDHPATCKVSATRHTKKFRFKFQEHQSLSCGEVYSLGSFRQRDTLYLVAGDHAGNVVRIFRWNEGRFVDTPIQTFHFPAPKTVEVLTAPDGVIWLMVAGSGPVTLYRLHENGRFQRSHTTEAFDGSVGTNKDVTDTVGFAELRGEFYRCYGRNRRETPVIVVHKLQDRPASGSRDVFRRIMRKKLPGEKVHQCSMYSEGNSLYTVVTLNKQDGRGRIMIGHLAKNRMKTVDVVSGHKLWRVSDSFGFTTERERYIVVSQAARNGKCLVYKRHWRNRAPVETG